MQQVMHVAGRAWLLAKFAGLLSEVVPDARTENLRCSLYKSSGRLLDSCSMVPFSETEFLGLLCSWFLVEQKEKQ